MDQSIVIQTQASNVWNKFHKIWSKLFNEENYVEVNNTPQLHFIIFYDQ